MRKKTEKSLTFAAQATNWVFMLHESCRMGDLERVKKAIDHGVGVNTPNNTLVNGWTALHYASHWGKPEIVRYLLWLGADPNIVNEAHETPLDVCVQDQNIRRAIEVALERKLLELESPVASQGNRRRF